MNRLLFCMALLIVLCSSFPTQAGTLQALVVEVQDGKTIIVENTNRRLKIILKGVEVPEANQPYGDAARQHLSDLILKRPVAVELTGLGSQSLLIAKIFWDEKDISLQMIRDGVAWLDASDDNDMRESDRLVYAEAEQAARGERRGLWQDASPVPPWAWRQAAEHNRATGNAVPVAMRDARADTSSPDEAQHSRQKSSANAPHSRQPASLKWPAFAPVDAPFSIQMPGGGKQYAVEVQVPDGQPFKANFYGVSHLKIGYLVVWASGLSQKDTIPALFEQTRVALELAAQAGGSGCEFSQEKVDTVNGYLGRYYKMHGCYLHGGIRLYYKNEGKNLKMSFVGVISEHVNDSAVEDFMKSFVIH
jgi:endonuclease YncB( thermonuclease family)